MYKNVISETMARACELNPESRTQNTQRDICRTENSVTHQKYFPLATDGGGEVAHADTFEPDMPSGVTEVFTSMLCLALQRNKDGGHLEVVKWFHDLNSQNKCLASGRTIFLDVCKNIRLLPTWENNAVPITYDNKSLFV